MNSGRDYLLLGTALLAGVMALAMARHAAASRTRLAADVSHPLAAQAATPSLQPVNLTFDGDQPGTVPGEVEVVTGQWTVVADADAPSQPNAFAQIGQGEGAPFNLCVVRGAAFADVVVELRFKAVAGRRDQGGGPMWRYQDKDNYYVARYNPLEGNFNVYRTVKGWRRTLQEADIKATPGWHRLKVVMVGAHIECYYDGQKRLDVKDTTFSGAGQVGLWSKADAQSHFDNLTAGPADQP